ncbi:MAG: hypothetical protein QOI26_2660, partial [Pseudonocardiales bacterium]|nr:hypothetical protein [Pseudonocardiales bacterium]
MLALLAIAVASAVTLTDEDLSAGTASLVMRLWQPISALTLPTLLCLILVSALH